MPLKLTLKERLTIEAGSVRENNLDSYEVLRNDETPEMNIALVEPPDTPPAGVGESAFAPVAPAIANALFAATGKRMRSLPISYDMVFPDAGTG